MKQWNILPGTGTQVLPARFPVACLKKRRIRENALNSLLTLGRALFRTLISQPPLIDMVKPATKFSFVEKIIAALQDGYAGCIITSAVII